MFGNTIVNDLIFSKAEFSQYSQLCEFKPHSETIAGSSSVAVQFSTYNYYVPRTG